ncbi:MAG: autoantigen p27 domain-containing protein [Methanoregula sp.]
MTARKDDEIMAEYLLKGGKMLEKCCKTCGCPLFEYKKKTFCVVCAEHEAQAAEIQPAAVTPKPAHHEDEAHEGHECTCGDSQDGSMLADELAGTILVLCQRIRDEKDPENCQVLMNSVKTGCEALNILCQL